MVLRKVIKLRMLEIQLIYLIQDPEQEEHELEKDWLITFLAEGKWELLSGREKQLRFED